VISRGKEVGTLIEGEGWKKKKGLRERNVTRDRQNGKKDEQKSYALKRNYFRGLRGRGVEKAGWGEGSKWSLTQKN